MDLILALGGLVTCLLLGNWVLHVLQGRDGLKSLEMWARSKNLTVVRADQARVGRKHSWTVRIVTVFDVILRAADGSTQTGVATVMYEGAWGRTVNVEFVPNVTAAEHYKQQIVQYWGEW
jgi:hypothetical protein